ncbi:MAG TPA: T9SS type A sorting domain-containing protein, partial [Chitinophagaceae bacterium]|nr:T9SS type A sorting domain-containing protein [Chitinophagaceae bacterium]
TYEITQNGCTSSMTKSILVNQCDERNLTIDQYPAIVLQGNPTHGPFSLRLNTDLYTTLTLKLFNNLGQLMKTQKATELTYGSVIPVDITNLPSGVYHLYIFSEEYGGKTKSFSVIKQ